MTIEEKELVKKVLKMYIKAHQWSSNEAVFAEVQLLINIYEKL